MFSWRSLVSEDRDKWHFLILWMWVQREKRETVIRIRDIRAGYPSGSYDITHCFCSSSLPSSRSLKQIGETAMGPARGQHSWDWPCCSSLSPVKLKLREMCCVGDTQTVLLQPRHLSSQHTCYLTANLFGICFPDQ